MPDRSSLSRFAVPQGSALTLLAVGLVACMGMPSRAAVRQDFYVTDGAVNAQARIGNVLYIGGNFSHVGPGTGGGVPVDNVLGPAVAGFPVVNGAVYAVTGDGAGGWYIGGKFGQVGALMCANLAHILPDLSVAAWSTGTDGPVHALELGGSTLYVGGAFGMVGGQSRAALAAVDANSGAVLPWNPGADDSVNTIRFTGTSVFVGGAFTHLGGQPHGHLGVVDAGSGTVAGWDPHVDGVVECTALSSGVLFVGGNFHHISLPAVQRNYAAAFDIGNLVPWTWDPNPDGPVHALAELPQACDCPPTMAVGGSFDLVGTYPSVRAASDLAVVDLFNGVVDWVPIPANNTYLVDVRSLGVGGGYLYAGGVVSSFANANPQRSGCESWLLGSHAPTAWHPNPAGRVFAIYPNVSAGLSVYLGGEFASVGGVSRSNLAAMDLTTGLLTSWTPQADAPVQALCAWGGTIYAGGDFSYIGNAVRTALAAIDTAGAVLPWAPNPDGEVSALHMSNDWLTLYVGGAFSSIAGQARGNLAAFDTTNPDATVGVRAFDPEPDGQVYTFAGTQDGVIIFVGGRFANVAGQPRGNFAALDVHDLSVAAPLLPADAMADGAIHALSLGADGRTLYAGGEFATIGGMARAHLAALDVTVPSGPINGLPWNPGADGPVYALSRSLNGRQLNVGGQFVTVDGLSSGNLAVFDTTKSGPGAGLTPGIPDADGPVYSLAQDASALYVGGAFRSIGGLLQSNIAALTLAQVSAVGPASPTGRFALHAPAPNPSFGAVRLDYELPVTGAVKLEIFDLSGARIRTVLDGRFPAGVGSAVWDGRSAQGGHLRPGAYFARLSAAGSSTVRRLVLLR
jgi:hypothetical protein